tara:strand:- start:64 stop:171 length:108 start_codon:yes stop_codon:yes gene_type:complete
MKDDQGRRKYVTGARYGQELADRRKSELEELGKGR